MHDAGLPGRGAEWDRPIRVFLRRFSGVADGAAEVALQISIVPFLATIMLLVQRMDSGGGSSPEDLVLHDRGVQIAGAIWAVCFMLGVYLGSGAMGV